MMGGGGNPSGGKKAVHVKVRLFLLFLIGEVRCTKLVYQDFIMTTVGKLQYDQPPRAINGGSLMD